MTEEIILSGRFFPNSYISENHLESTPKSFNGVNWYISVDTTYDYLTVSIHNDNASYLQSFDTNIKVNLEYENNRSETDNLEKTFDFKFDHKNNTFCIKDFIALEEFGKYYEDYDFSINAIIHFSANREKEIVEEIDFCDPNSASNDIILKFKDSPDKVLYSSKCMLSINSKVFKVMFNSDFEEKNKKTIDLDDKFEEFKALLKAIYPTNQQNVINRENIEILINLADKYDMPFLMNRCVAFIRNAEDIPNDVKFLLADRYSLPVIHNECIQRLNDVKSLENLQDSEVFENLTDEEASKRKRGKWN
ncbi:unnamed protein product [Caenorhabditis angaria]|uniref:BTB domain-containing protein n=1 Tax=Caenorhabditis angaria TaxID=860376 RepID=A0A9P1ISK0_9PELO|nr:unnamed protein product [Caenorhabditis angaria]